LTATGKVVGRGGLDPDMVRPLSHGRDWVRASRRLKPGTELTGTYSNLRRYLLLFEKV